MGEDISTKINSLSSILTVVLALFIVVPIMIAKINTDKYKYEVVADLVSVENQNDDANVIGYAYVQHGAVRVYNEELTLSKYMATYQYMYNGYVYRFQLRSITEPSEQIRIYLNEDNPSEFCFASDKVSLKELVRTN